MIMPVKIVETDLPGVLSVEQTIFRDDRGYFFESYNEAQFHQGGIPNRFIQDNQSRSTYGVIRGLHAQSHEHAQAKLVRVLQGRILDVAVDVRDGSPTFGQHVAVELSDETQHQLFIPRGFLHGFSVLSETAVIAYKCDNAYCRDAECGVRYDDPALGIDWRIDPAAVRVSDKDRDLGGLADVARYRG